MGIKRLIKWFKNKSIQQSERNIEEYLTELVEIANQAYKNIQITGTTNPSDIKAVQRAKDRLIIQLCGPIPLDEVKQKFIDPLLNRQDLTEGAKMAINHVFDYAKANIKE